jgi:hypothetical protein
MARGFGATKGTSSASKIVSPLTSWFTTSVSYSIWVNRNGAGGNSFGRALSKEATTTAHALIFGWDNTNARWSVQFPWTTTSPEWTAPAGATATATWFHFLVTYNGGSTSNNPIVYCNGVSQTVTKQTSPVGSLDLTGSNNWTLGNRSSDSLRVFDGIIGHFALWKDSILGQSEATALAGGVSPLLIGNFSKPDSYVELINLFDWRNGACTNTATQVQPHYPQFRGPPRRKAMILLVTAQSISDSLTLAATSSFASASQASSVAALTLAETSGFASPSLVSSVAALTLAETASHTGAGVVSSIDALALAETSGFAELAASAAADALGVTTTPAAGVSGRATEADALSFPATPGLSSTGLAGTLAALALTSSPTVAETAKADAGDVLTVSTTAAIAPGYVAPLSLGVYDTSAVAVDYATSANANVFLTSASTQTVYESDAESSAYESSAL